MGEGGKENETLKYNECWGIGGKVEAQFLSSPWESLEPGLLGPQGPQVNHNRL